MAGLCAAVRVRELGADPVLFEKGSRPGGSMLLSSGVLWRHASLDDFRRECRAGHPELQRLVWERLDDAIAWLRRLGAPVLSSATGNPHTAGVRIDPPGLVRALVEALPAGSLQLDSELPPDVDRGVPTILATGGFAASSDLVARFIRPAAPLRRRGNRWSTGSGLRIGLGRGAALSSGMDEFYGRNMPDRPWGEDELVPLAQIYARRARIFDTCGKEFFAASDVSWSEANVVQATAKRPGARAYYLLDNEALHAVVAHRRVEEMVEAAGAAREDVSSLPFEAPRGTVAAIRVVASITHTVGGLRVDPQARVLDGEGTPISGLFAAGVDAGGIASGGYSSGLAQAAVLGLVAAETAVAA
jgi:succinate dehydrogenase/fumarate reductase flavoprotein subunit